MTNIYRLLSLFGKLKSPRVKLLGLYILHFTGRRFLGAFPDLVLACHFGCKMCYLGDPEKRKTMRVTLMPNEIEVATKSFSHTTLKRQIGRGYAPDMYKDPEQIKRIRKGLVVPCISLTAKGNLFSKPTLEALIKVRLNEVTISTHGIREKTYEELMVKEKMELFLRLLDDLKEIKKEYPHLNVCINYNMNADNIDEWSDFREVFRDIPFDILQQAG